MSDDAVMSLPEELRDFIGRSTFAFIASHGSDEKFDVSPRGDTPALLTMLADHTLLMPDRAGNNRIDTLRNVLRRPHLRLAMLVVDEPRFLQIDGTAQVSTERRLLELFAVRGELPASVLRIRLASARFIRSLAFDDSGFWSRSNRGAAPLPLKAMIDGQIAFHHGQSVPPNADAPATMAELERVGLKNAYLPLEPYVKGKAFATFDPYTREFLSSTRFAMLSSRTGMTLFGGEEGFADVLDERHLRLRSRHEPLVAEVTLGAYIGGLLGRPGRNEALRLNGTVVLSQSMNEERVTVIRTEEIFLHCANAFARSRIWRPQASLAWTGTRRFVCSERIEESRGIVSYLLAPDDDAPLPPFRPGQYVTVSGSDDSTWSATQRCYSLSDAPGREHFRITIRRLPDGAMSRWLHDRIQPGAFLRLGAPRGRFTFNDVSNRMPVFISAGIGVTPVMSMLLHLTNTAPGRPVWFIHGARNGDEHAMRDLLKAQADANPGLRTHVLYSQPQPDDRIGHHFNEAGRIDIAAIERLLDIHEVDFYLCGPALFMTAIRQSLAKRGVADDRVRTELFGAVSPDACSGRTSVRNFEGRTPLITFTKSAKQVAWDDAAGTLLDLALKYGLSAPFICRSGDCQSCALPLESGEVTYPDDIDILPPEGFVLMCQATPDSDLVIEL